MTDGWVPAKVVQDCKNGKVWVEHVWPHFFTMRGHYWKSRDHHSEQYSLEEVKRLSEPSPRLELVMPGSVPELSIITFRWGGYNQIVVPQQWGETGSSVSDVFINSFLDQAVKPTLGSNYEVWTVYIEGQTDLNKIADSAHLIFGASHPARRARNTCAMYFLYPTAFEEGCVPTHETGEDDGAALVDQAAFFRCMKAVERAGVPTRFPHPSNLYEILASKRWTSMMSVSPSHRVPPTVALPRQLTESNLAEATDKALKALIEVKEYQLQQREKIVPNTAKEITKGVAKLGFSWEALDVKFWEGRDGLEEALYSLTQTIEISQDFTGQPHDLESIIVQEYCVHDMEVRLYVVEGNVEATIYTKFARIKENQEFGDFAELHTRDEAAEKWMGGDHASLVDGERQCLEVTQHWLAWVKTQICELPPALRFDYFVGRTDKAGQAIVWTLEICELGFSMLGSTDLPGKVFSAMLRSCLSTRSPAAAPVSSTTQVLVPRVARGEDAEVLVPRVARGEDAEAKCDNADDEESDSEDSSDGDTIAVVVPRTKQGTSDQSDCTGKYKRTRVFVQGRPVWRHKGHRRFIYFGMDKYWYIGDEEEESEGFNCCCGYIRHEGDGNVSPADLPGLWERGEEWEKDREIIVTANADILLQSKGGGGGGGYKGKGKSKKGKK
eukprot:TRINITY_DN5890_c0_g1_i1.p1 TRINITY_DN5890_c0_g1~~TRINITY_DN5890_c0_g1_i1.p1  ORF type:complete len:729 (-),score=159.13 TRINITY_DN5890_c0_g1_i1:97-2097(-)